MAPGKADRVSSARQPVGMDAAAPAHVRRFCYDPPMKCERCGGQVRPCRFHLVCMHCGHDGNAMRRATRTGQRNGWQTERLRARHGRTFHRRGKGRPFDALLAAVGFQPLRGLRYPDRMTLS